MYEGKPVTKSVQRGLAGTGIGVGTGLIPPLAAELGGRLGYASTRAGIGDLPLSVELVAEAAAARLPQPASRVGSPVKPLAFDVDEDALDELAQPPAT